MKLTWEAFLWGCLASGVVNSMTTWQVIMADNVITRSEWISLIGAFIGGIALYLSNHKDQWDGMERRTTGSEAERHDVPSPNTPAEVEKK